MTLNLSMPTAAFELKPKITVVGVGGAGGNAVNNMIKQNLEGVEFIVANTDAQALSQSLCQRRIQLGQNLTAGLGAGSRPDVGRAAAEEALDEIIRQLQGSNMVFITAGMGGGTGTGGAPIVAGIAKEMGALTVGVVTRPFEFEKLNRANIADQGIQEMRKAVDTLLVIPNQRLLDILDAETTTESAFRMADDVLRKSIQSISDVITTPGEINMDLNDIRAVMKDAGEALIGMGEASGPGRAINAAKAAIHSPLLENVVMDGAKGLIVNVTGRRNTMKLAEMEEAMALITGAASQYAKIKAGHAYDEAMGDVLRITVIATGFPARRGNRNLSRAGLTGATARRHPLDAPDPSDSRTSAPEDWSKPAFMRLKVRKLK